MITKDSPKRIVVKPRRKNSRQPSYPHIERKTGVVGGEPVVSGTRTSVRAIAGYYQMGKTVDEILGLLSHLTHAQVHAALTYYFDNKNEIDKLIKENSDYERWERMALTRPKQGR